MVLPDLEVWEPGDIGNARFMPQLLDEGRELTPVMGWVVKQALLISRMNPPHPQPFSPGRRAFKSSSLALWERARVRVDQSVHTQIQQRR